LQLDMWFFPGIPVSFINLTVVIFLEQCN